MSECEKEKLETSLRRIPTDVWLALLPTNGLAKEISSVSGHIVLVRRTRVERQILPWAKIRQ